MGRTLRKLGRKLEEKKSKTKPAGFGYCILCHMVDSYTTPKTFALGIALVASPASFADPGAWEEDVCAKHREEMVKAYAFAENVLAEATGAVKKAGPT